MPRKARKIESLQGGSTTINRATETDRYVAGRIRERRVMLGLSQKQMADMIGVTYQQTHKYERAINRISASQKEKVKMKQSSFPPGWDLDRVKKVLTHYESLSEEEAVAEDEAAYEELGQTVMEVPTELVPVFRELIAKHKAV